MIFLCCFLWQFSLTNQSTAPFFPSRGMVHIPLKPVFGAARTIHNIREALPMMMTLTVMTSVMTAEHGKDGFSDELDYDDFGDD